MALDFDSAGSAARCGTRVSPLWDQHQPGLVGSVPASAARDALRVGSGAQFASPTPRLAAAPPEMALRQRDTMNTRRPPLASEDTTQAVRLAQLPIAG